MSLLPRRPECPDASNVPASPDRVRPGRPLRRLWHSAQRRLLARAHRFARKLGRGKVAWIRALSPLLEATIRAQQGDLEAATTELRTAITRLDEQEMQLYAAAARVRLGALLGGDEGAALQRSASAFMERQRVKEPARMVNLLAPGFPES